MTLKPEIIITSDSRELARAGVRIFVQAAKDAVAHRGCFTAALSGGSTPRLMYGMLAREPYCSRIAWEKIHLFWVDERCVSENDPASNYGAARKDFLDQVPIPADHVHPMPGEAAPEEGAKIYQNELLRFVEMK